MNWRRATTIGTVLRGGTMKRSRTRLGRRWRGSALGLAWRMTVWMKRRGPMTRWMARWESGGGTAKPPVLAPRQVMVVGGGSVAVVAGVAAPTTTTTTQPVWL